MGLAATWLERHQVAVYPAALAIGAFVGLLAPPVAGPAGAAVLPMLAALLYATFLGIPLAGLPRALADWRFLATLGVVNFAIAPAVAWLLSRLVAHDAVLLVGVLLVLLTPCVDDVIVFTELAGGDARRLLAAAPLLMVAQMLALPPLLAWFAGPDALGAIDLAPFIEAFALVIVLPLAAAVLTQLAGRRMRAVRTWARRVSQTMVPITALTLAVVVASQISGIGARIQALLLVVPVFVLFAAVMTGLGAIAGRIAGLEPSTQRAVLFSGVTRNSLVVLPLALALPAANGLAPLVVVTQTLVELVVMVVLMPLAPRLLPERRAD